MENLHQQQESDLHDVIEGEWKTEVILTAPDGTVQEYSANNPTEKLGGYVRYIPESKDPETGESIIVNMPVAVLRISSLDRVPVDGEKWFIQMPIAPTAGATVRSFVFTETRALEKGTDMGFIKIYPSEIDQS